MEFLYEYGLFLLKAITFVAAVAVIIGIAVSAGMKQKSAEAGAIDVTKINDRFDDMRKSMKRAMYDDDVLKKEEKDAEKEKKREKKQAKKSNDEKEQKKRVFLIDFDGDMKASAVTQLREVVSAILFTANEKDEVVLRLESPGGMVHGYGLAASQLDRIRQRNIPLTVCVDKVAASGGYMMACVANKICAAPFAVIGSIGVVAQLPNFHKLLKKHDVDFELLTAGEYKRTLTLFGENTDKARDKFVEDLENTHQLFKDYVKGQRSVVDIESVATGEIWFGIKALEEKLIDELITSDDYVTGLASEYDIFEVSYTLKKSLPERLGIAVQAGVERGVSRLVEQLQVSRFFQ
ncbi:MAG: protease SohB [Cellvibrionaceae bacterium]